MATARQPDGDRDRSMRGRVLVVDHRAVVATGLQMALSERCWEVETTSGPTAIDVIAHARDFQPQCVLMDIHLGGGMGCGIELVRSLSTTGARVVMLTCERRRMVLAECLDAGAAGWISREAELDDVDSSLDHLLAGGNIIGRADRADLLHELRLERAARLRSHSRFERLTQREALVLGALLDGRSADEIAHAHFVSLTTVRTQIRAVLQKLDVRSQLAAVAVASAHLELLPAEVGAGRNRRRTHRHVGGGPDYRR